VGVDAKHRRVVTAGSEFNMWNGIQDPMTLHYFDLALRLAVALLGGAILGTDRETKDKPIGIRAYAMISVGACAFAILSLELGAIGESRPGISAIDPARVVQGVIGGIGFLGAGAIFRKGDEVSGTATGAGIWTSGAVGLACGFGYFVFAGMVVVAALLIFAALGAYFKTVAKFVDKKSGAAKDD
jgi:putative Mg2+ transporter-C (MgtC) family protein